MNQLDALYSLFFIACAIPGKPLGKPLDKRSRLLLLSTRRRKRREEIRFSLYFQVVRLHPLWPDFITARSNFFNLRIVGGGVQTGSTRQRGLLLSYCACPGWLWGWRIIRWNEDWQGKPKYSEKTCTSATLSTTNPIWPDLGSNPGRRGGKPATNRLSYGAATAHSNSQPLTAW
jgi:hypothetical protein